VMSKRINAAGGGGSKAAAELGELSLYLWEEESKYEVLREVQEAVRQRSQLIIPSARSRQTNHAARSRLRALLPH
jgi:hypothetical protein